MRWNPMEYTKFDYVRHASFIDAVALLQPRSGIKVLDVGCGPGSLTIKLPEVFPDSLIVGIDPSSEMLQQAAKLTRPGIEFRQQSLEEISEEWDVVFCHSVLQWLPDHERLVKDLWKLVRSGGQFVVQMPSNHNHISHTLMRNLAQSEPFVSALNGWTRITPVLDIETYAQLLWDLGGSNITIYEKIYPQIFDSIDQIIEWLHGTGLRPYLQRLPEQLRDVFIEHYRERLREVLPSQPVFYGFRRILWSALKEDA